MKASTAYRLVQDYIFREVSAATAALLGSSSIVSFSNGRMPRGDRCFKSKAHELELSEIQQIFWEGFEEHVNQHGQQVKLIALSWKIGER